MNGILGGPFEGVHCETTAFINLALSTGTSLTEPMAFGLGCGLSFIYRHSKRMLQPFVGGRVKPDWIMRNASAALGLELIEEQTTSPRKAESELLRNLDRGRVVGLKLDRFYLDYTHDEYHFPAHYVACLGYSGNDMILAETTPLGIQTTSRFSLAAARAAKGPMSSRHLSLRLEGERKHTFDIVEACRYAIRQTSHEFLNPSISNSGHKGIAKTAGRITKWPLLLADPVAAAHRTGVLMERGGTGGGLFRGLWSVFLREAYRLSGVAAYRQGAESYREIAAMWTEFADLLRGTTGATLAGDLERGAAMLGQLAYREYDAMSSLAKAVP